MSKPLSSQAAAAKAIRAELKAAYPSVDFKIRSRSASMMTAVDIDWTDGPTTKQVDAITDKYQYGHFDGMVDLYEYSNTREDIPQAKYVQTQRDISEQAFRAMAEYLNRHCGYSLRVMTSTYGSYAIDPQSDGPRSNNWDRQSDDIWSTFSETSLVCPYCHAATLPGDAYCPACGLVLDPQQATRNRAAIAHEPAA